MDINRKTSIFRDWKAIFLRWKHCLYTIYSLDVLLSQFWTSPFSMSGSKCCLWGFHPDFAYHPGMLWASTSIDPQSHHQGALEMKQFCPGMYHWSVAVGPPTLEGTIGRVHVTTQRVPWHRIGHRPQFPVEALMAPLVPTAFFPLSLSAAFEF